PARRAGDHAAAFLDYDPHARRRRGRAGAAARRAESHACRDAGGRARRRHGTGSREAMNAMSRHECRLAVGLFAASVLANAAAHADQVFEYRSLQDVEMLFATYHYTPKDWHAGNFEVPRIYLDDVPSSWRETHAKRIPTAEKKTLFFRFLAPLALYV